MTRVLFDSVVASEKSQYIQTAAVRLQEAPALAVAAIEEAIGQPVVTSNQASAWCKLRLCGDDMVRPEFKRLHTLPLPRD